VVRAIRHRVAKPLLQLLHTKPTLVEEYMAVVKDGVGGVGPLGALVHLLVLHLSSPTQAALSATHKVSPPPHYAPSAVCTVSPPARAPTE
jgi:hypothetical protein